MIYRFLFALVLLLLVGCQKETIELEDDFRPNPDGSVAFRLHIENSEINNSGSATKGTPQNGLEKYDSVCVNIYSHIPNYETAVADNKTNFFQKIRLEKDDLTLSWKSTPPLFWPIPTDTLLSFFAYALDTEYVFDAAPLADLDTVISFLPSTGMPDSILYQVPSDVTRQPDLLVSTLFNQPKTDNISLTMKHALACVSFVGTAPEAGTYVKSITLRNVYGKGALALDAPSIEWTVYPDSKNFTVYEAGIKTDEELKEEPKDNQEPLDNNYLMTADGYLMMIPQKLTNAAIDVLYWNGQDDTANKMITYLLPADKDKEYSTWLPGKKYIYKFGTQSEDITVVYYEKYADTSYGLYNDKRTLQNPIVNDKVIEEAGYGVLSKEKVGSSSVLPIRLTATTSTPVTSGNIVELTDGFLYPVSQTGTGTFTLTASSIPQDVYFNGSSQPCGMIVPHFAKGVYTVETGVAEHAIRTPQQMRNITFSDASSDRLVHTYTQELNLDFSKEGIGGGSLTNAVVNREFKDLFNGQSKRIENVTMDATWATNGALFQHNSGEIKEVILLNSSITSSGNTGGIAAVNNPGGVITHSRVIGELSGKPFTITGTSGYTGAIAGFNSGKIIGNQTIEEATEIPIAEVSGWVSITGSIAGTGGITGQNGGTIKTCLVNGVYVTGNSVQVAKISIKGEQYVGGIAGANLAQIDGNFSVNGTEPNVAGLVSITSSGSWVGGIAGTNKGANAVLNKVNLRLGRGDASNAIIITGLESVGGIVGANEEGGKLNADGTSFISVRGNVRITGTNMVGGIVGNNQSGSISNCFVYNFFSQSQTEPLVHYAPKISGTLNVGGIVGYAGSTNAGITNCAVFSTVSAINVDGGDATNAVVEITSSTNAAAGIIGRSFSGLTLKKSYVLGNVSINAKKGHAGGIVGVNTEKTTISEVHIGNSSAEVTTVYTDLFDVVKLPVRDPRMKTDEKVMTSTSGTPTITGIEYVGGICGLNSGTIDGIEMNDNVKIGTSTTNYVGGIAGGNTTDAYVQNCKTYNPLSGGTVEIVGNLQVGGIVGLNNGIVKTCQVGLAGAGKSNLITINGAGILGGIAGSTGGNVTGNANTTITDCNVYGKVKIIGYGENVGGILGQNQPTSKVVNCNVIGYRSTYTDAKNYDYDVTVVGGKWVGGIAGTNTGEIYGDPGYCKVTHTSIRSEGGLTGGLVGSLKTTAAKLYNCDVSHGVLISFLATHCGAFAGQLDGGGATETSHSLFGTSPTGAKNRIYMGTTVDPVRINGNDTRVSRPLTIVELAAIFPPDPPKHGNLWADYQLWNYLYWEEYE